MAAASLKPKHVEGLVERWQAEGLAVGTIKNRMAELRWWAEKIGKQNVIARDNDHYLTARCVVWDLAEVMSWLQRRRQDGYSGVKKAPMPDVRQRMRRPIGAKG